MSCICAGLSRTSGRRTGHIAYGLNTIQGPEAPHDPIGDLDALQPISVRIYT
jgi:hypothetical protein